MFNPPTAPYGPGFLRSFETVAIISRSFSGCTKTISLQLAGSQYSGARLISRLYDAQFSCSRLATTRLLLPISCWPPGILLVVRSVRFARTLWLAPISACFWEQPPCYILGPRSRAGSRHAEGLCGPPSGCWHHPFQGCRPARKSSVRETPSCQSRPTWPRLQRPYRAGPCPQIKSLPDRCWRAGAGQCPIVFLFRISNIASRPRM